MQQHPYHFHEARDFAGTHIEPGNRIVVRYEDGTEEHCEYLGWFEGSDLVTGKPFESPVVLIDGEDILLDASAIESIEFES